MNLPANLQQIQRRIRDVAKSLGLDFFETIFEMLDSDQLNEVAAYGGFPTRYPHWRHGMEYEHLAKSYRYGLSKIYELVINNDPCYAYLMASNSLVDQKLVIAHVYAHCDFFKNNAWFARTDRHMIDRMANHAARIRSLMERHGQDRVEAVLDRALSIENLIDMHAPYVPAREVRRVESGDDQAEETPALNKLRSKDYMDRFINPPDFMKAQQRRADDEERRKKRFPPEPVRDVLHFLLEHAPLERFEWEVLNCVREEAQYFAPQRMTKIMNEGWASFWHRRIMTEHMLTDEEVIDYAQTMAGTLAGGGTLNPYKIGLEIWLDIEDRWNRGRHGLEFERCEDQAGKDTWDTHEMAGRDMIFRVRRAYNDVTFVDEFLTEDLCHRTKMFVYQWNPQTGRREIATRDFDAVKSQLLRQLANGGSPVLDVVDANHGNRGELVLVHRFDGAELRPDWTDATLRNVAHLWKRPVVLHTFREGKPRIITCDGERTEINDTAETAASTGD